MKYPALTTLFRAYRKDYPSYVVYSVDFGKPEDYNIVLSAAEFDGDTQISETVEMILAKSWIAENMNLTVE